MKKDSDGWYLDALAAFACEHLDQPSTVIMTRSDQNCCGVGGGLLHSSRARDVVMATRWQRGVFCG